jgi:hypothetical protein
MYIGQLYHQQHQKSEHYQFALIYREHGRSVCYGGYYKYRYLEIGDFYVII